MFRETYICLGLVSEGNSVLAHSNIFPPRFPTALALVCKCAREQG